MTDFICPNCRGGFDDPENVRGTGSLHCPWCHQPLDGSYEFEPITRSVIREKDETDTGGFLGKFK